MAITVVLKSPPHTGFSAHTSGWCRKHDCVYDPSAIAGGTTAGRQNRCPEQPPHARALCHSFLFAGGTPGRRDSSSEARRCETNETFGDKNILVRPRLSTRILDSYATLDLVKTAEAGMPASNVLPGNVAQRMAMFAEHILVAFFVPRLFLPVTLCCNIQVR
jgi:hypothetical protein